MRQFRFLTVSEQGGHPQIEHTIVPFSLLGTLPSLPPWVPPQLTPSNSLRLSSSVAVGRSSLSVCLSPCFSVCPSIDYISLSLRSLPFVAFKKGQGFPSGFLRDETSCRLNLNQAKRNVFRLNRHLCSCLDRHLFRREVKRESTMCIR